MNGNLLITDCWSLTIHIEFYDACGIKLRLLTMQLQGGANIGHFSASTAQPIRSLVSLYGRGRRNLKTAESQALPFLLTDTEFYRHRAD